MPPAPRENVVEPIWAEWWRFNQASFLEWEEGGARGSGVAAETIREKVVPALLGELAGGAAPALERQLLMALARIGDPTGAGKDAAVRTAIEERIAHADFSCRSTAVLALGVLGDPASARKLLAILDDGEEARLSLDLGGRIDLETRAFSAYALGLLGGRVKDPVLRGRIVASLWRILQPPRRQYPDLETAAVIALGLVPLEPGPDPPETQEPWPPSTLKEQVHFLLALACEETLPGEWESVRAQAPRSVTRLCSAAPGMKEEIARALLPFVTKRGLRGSRLVRTSASIAMGFLGDLDDDPLDVEIRAALQEATANPDHLVKVESLCALGRNGARPGRGEHPVAGAEELRRHLWTHAARGRSNFKPYALQAALATEIGIRGRGEPTPEWVLEAAREQMTTRSQTELRAVAGIFLGLLGDRESASWIARQLPESLPDPLDGYLALGLAWTGDESAIALTGKILAGAETGGESLEQAALAAARTRDVDLVISMLERLRRSDSRETCRALARGLARCRAPGLVEALVETLRDDELPVQARAHAAAILGHLCASRSRPWEEELKVGLNYYAAPSTLTGPAGIGVLDFP